MTNPRRCYLTAPHYIATLTLLSGLWLPIGVSQAEDPATGRPPATAGEANAERDASADGSASLDVVLERIALAADRVDGSTANTSPGERSVATEGNLFFNFRAQPWKEALDWLADEAGYSLVADHPPTGTCNYVDTRRYTPEEAVDVFNRLLLVKGYSLVRRGRMLWLINLEDEIPPKLLPTIMPKELDERGEFELVEVIFQLNKVTPQEIETEIQPLLSPIAIVKRLEGSRQLWLTETAGRLRTIRGVIESMDSATRGTVVPKTYVIARTAPSTLQSFLGTMLEDTPNLKFSLDPASGNLIALAAEEQHEVIRGLLVQLGESGETYDSRLAARQNLRIVPLTGSAQEGAIQAIRQIYGNRLRIVTPSASAPATREQIPADNGASPTDNYPGIDRSRSPLERGRLILPSVPQRESTDPTADAFRSADGVIVAERFSSIPLTRVAQALGGAPLEENSDAEVVPVDEPRLQDDVPPEQSVAQQPEPSTDVDSPSDALPAESTAVQPGVTVATTPRGIVIRSDDLDMLDDVEALIRSFAGTAGGPAEHTFFFLRNATAAAAAQTIKGIIGSGSGDSESAGLFGADVYTGPPQINADERLNALIVKASPADLNRIEELLEVIDQDGAPETHITPRPRVIPVVYADVEAIEEIVKATFEPDLYTGNNSRGGGGDRDRRAREWMARFGGGGGDNDDRDRGDNNNNDNSNDRNKKMTVTADKVNNALIVSAPQQLYEEVVELVHMLDVGTPAMSKTARVVTLHRTNAQSVQGALSAMFGDAVTARTAAAGEQSSPNGSSGDSSRDDRRQRDEDERRRDEFRRRMEFFQRMRGGGDRGGDGDRGGRGR